MNERARERFIRWQGRTLDQFSFASNLVLGLSAAALGLAVTALLDHKVPPSGLSHWLFLGAVGLHASATIVGIGLAYNRLLDFRKTMHATKAKSSQLRVLRRETKELGKASWRLLWVQGVAFVLGVLALLAFVMRESS